jgi:hypothetical protein
MDPRTEVENFIEELCPLTNRCASMPRLVTRLVHRRQSDCLDRTWTVHVDETCNMWTSQDTTGVCHTSSRRLFGLSSAISSRGGIGRHARIEQYARGSRGVSIHRFSRPNRGYTKNLQNWGRNKYNVIITMSSFLRAVLTI